MQSSEFLCARCARHKQTCCQGTEIFVTPGDVQRIGQHTGRIDFTEFRVPGNLQYLDQDDDPVWREHVARADGSRRVLKRRADGDCTFLGEHGCTLPGDVRPLVCRLFPYDYTAAGLRVETAEGCPLELLAPGQELEAALQMNRDDARRWHQQLYQEIQLESEHSEEDRQLICSSD